jgi:hypothetical protein
VRYCDIRLLGLGNNGSTSWYVNFRRLCQANQSVNRLQYALNGLKMDNKTTTRVSGLVIPIDWDDEGTVLGAAIFDREERQFVIQQDDMGKQLLGLVHEDVEVEATVTTQTKGHTVLRVKNYWLKTDDNRREVFGLKKSEKG